MLLTMGRAFHETLYLPLVPADPSFRKLPVHRLWSRARVSARPSDSDGAGAGGRSRWRLHRARTRHQNARYRLCGNQIDHAARNWAVPDGEDQRFCRACRLNEIIPNLADPAADRAWLALEDSKRRLIYTLLQLRLPIESRTASK